jgi:hypothetical protein
LNKLKVFGWFMFIVGVLSLPIPYDFDVIEAVGYEYIIFSLISSVFWIAVGLVLILHVRKKERKAREKIE